MGATHIDTHGFHLHAARYRDSEAAPSEPRRDDGQGALPELHLRGTDCRFWRLLGVPAVSYGPRVYGMGGVDEHITVEDLEATASVHMGTLIDFLTGRG